MQYLKFIIYLFPILLLSQNNNNKVLEQIKVLGKKHHSDAIIIKQNEKIVYEDYFGEEDKPKYIASAGKSLVGLAIGTLLYEKFIDSLDQPVHTLFPEWRQGTKKDITIRMLVNHTSGLQNHPNASIEIEPAPDYKLEDIIQLALCAEVSHPPGTHFAYNNKAIALLGGVIEKASGMAYDKFMIKYFYEPMGITEYGWIKDKSGNPTTHGAHKIRGLDFLKFGELLLNNGVYKGKRYISEAYAKESIMQSQEFTSTNGLLWWLIPKFHKRLIDDEIIAEWKTAKVTPAFLKKMQPLFNKEIATNELFYEQLENILGANYINLMNKSLGENIRWAKHMYSDEIIGAYADGYRGNYLVILPKYNIVAVRIADHEGFDYKNKDDFFSFKNLVIQFATKQ